MYLCGSVWGLVEGSLEHSRLHEVKGVSLFAVGVLACCVQVVIKQMWTQCVCVAAGVSQTGKTSARPSI
jgi:hypothetical protein